MNHSNEAQPYLTPAMKNELPGDVFLFGASYAPYAKAMDWPVEEWDGDLATMRQLNFNTVRIFAPWDRIEQEEGCFDYTKQDHLFDLAARHDLRVILNFGGVFGNLCGIYPPRYLLEGDRCQVRMATPDTPDTKTSPEASLCPDDPEHRRKAFEFMERTVRRYASRNELLAWMIWNEPASPFCYCPHTQAKFRDWVRTQYGSLEHLNAIWGTEYPLNYKAWEQILAPTGPGVLSMWYDWVRFNQERLHSTMREISELTARCDPRQRPTTSNLVHNMMGLEGNDASPRYGLDTGRVGQSISIMGISCYTVEHRRDVVPAYSTAYKLSRARSASLDEHRRVLVLETGAGPNLRMLTEAQRLQTYWHLIAHNAKSILVWNYRSRLTDTQVALFNLMKWDGSMSRRAESAGEFSRILQANARLLNHVYPERQAAILTLEDQQIQMEAICGIDSPSSYQDCHDSRIGAYKLLWDLQIPTDCIAENNLDEISRYPLLLVPMAEHMTPELAERLRHYVAGGGTVIAESPFAFRDSNGRLQTTAPAFGLEEVFGCRTRDREGKETAPEILCPEGPAKVFLFWSEYEPCGGEVLARYANGSAAVVCHRHGKGMAIVAGTEVFRQYVQDEQASMSALLKTAILASGVLPSAHLTGECNEVEVSRLAGEGELVYLFINHNETECRFRAELRAPAGPWINLHTGCPVDFAKEVHLPCKGVLAVQQKRDTPRQTGT